MMRIKSVIALAALAACGWASSASAVITSIQHNLLDAVPDTSYNGGVLTMTQVNNNNLTVNEDGSALGGTVSNASLSLTTFFSHAEFDGGDITAVFLGGTFSLNFDFNSGGGPSSYSIGGPIAGMEFHVISGNQISGEGLFNAGSPTLPGSGIWQAPGLSSITSLTFVFNGVNPLNGFDWENGTLGGNTQSLVTLLPDDSAAPEPVSAMFLLVGGLLVTRRRR